MKIARNRILWAAIALIALSISPAQLFAGISFTGDVQQIAPPASAAWEQLESSEYVYFWEEKTNVTLSEALSVDIINPVGMYDRANVSYKGDDLPAGTYNSYIIHADKQGDNETFSGSITLDSKIVAILYKGPGLNDTDSIFGATGTTYATGSTRRFELDGDVNWFEVSADGRTLSFQNYVPHDLDNLRMITVPEPATLMLLGLGALTLRKRKK